MTTTFEWSKPVPPPNLRSQREEEWTTACSRIRSFSSAARMWERVLTKGERARLGDNLETAFEAFCGTAGMWKKLRGVDYPTAVIQVGRAIGTMSEETSVWLQRELGIIVDDPDRALEEAIAAGHLVVADTPRECYWASKKIDIDWHRRNAIWELLILICKCGKSGQCVDRLCFGESNDVQYATKLKWRMCTTKEFPTTLTPFIESMGRGTVQLKLPPEQIRIFESVAPGHLREWHP